MLSALLEYHKTKHNTKGYVNTGPQNHECKYKTMKCFEMIKKLIRRITCYFLPNIDLINVHIVWPYFALYFFL
jgi:hypothetical protein